MKAIFLATVMAVGLFLVSGCMLPMSGGMGGDSGMMPGCGPSISHGSMTPDSGTMAGPHAAMGQRGGNPDSAMTDGPSQVQTGHSHGASHPQGTADNPQFDQEKEEVRP
jgi:hypothetical protein